MSPPEVAVVILNWNGVDYLRKFLPSVLASNYENKRIIVADNGSTDESLAVLESEFPEVEIIINKENYGFAGGYNEALKHVDSPLYILLNSDVKVDPNWIQPLVSAMESDPQIAAAQPKLLAFDQPDHFEYAGAAGGFLDQFGYPFCRGRIFEHCEPDQGQYDDSVDIFWASGAAMCIRSERYHELGGLDADFFAHMEEIDLCWRIKNLGYRIVYRPESVVYHVGGGTLNKANPRKTYLNFRNNLSMLFKNYTAWQLLFMLPIRYSMDVLAAYRALFSGDSRTFKAIAKAHFSFFGAIPKLVSKRRKINRQRKQLTSRSRNLAGYYEGSIVWKHFVSGLNRFSELEEVRR